MLDSILNKGIPIGILLALLDVAAGVMRTGALQYKFVPLKFVAIAVLGGIVIGVIIEWVERLRRR